MLLKFKLIGVLAKMKKTFLTLATVGIITLTGCSGGGSTVIKSNAGSVTKEMVYDQIKDTDEGKQVIKDLTEKQILEKKYKVTDEEINKEIKDLREELGFSKEQFKESLPTFGYNSEKDLQNDMKNQLLMIKVITGGKLFSDKELKKEYDSADYNYRITASHILVENEEIANEVKAQLDGGADFAALAKEKSMDTASAENGGSLQPFTKGTMVAEFEEAAFKMKEGEISAPIKSQFGYHIIQVTQKEKLSFKEMKSTLKNELLVKNSKSYDSPMEKYEEEIKKLEKEANIKVKDEDLKELFELEEENKEKDSK